MTRILMIVYGITAEQAAARAPAAQFAVTSVMKGGVPDDSVSEKE